MTKRDRAALRRSIIRIVLADAYGRLLAPVDRSADEWDDYPLADRQWWGPEVQEECKAVYEMFRRASIEE